MDPCESIPMILEPGPRPTTAVQLSHELIEAARGVAQLAK
jgi:hypothetical protein